METAIEKPTYWEKKYRDGYNEASRALQPEWVLSKYANLIPVGKILDLGVGSGRNAIYFAKKGYEIQGIDISSTAIEQCIANAKKECLTIDAKTGDLKNFSIKNETYSLIIAGWVLNFFKINEINKIIENMKNGLKKGGIIYIGIFSIDDPGHKRRKKCQAEIEPCTFYDHNNNYFFHYFDKYEVLAQFTEFNLIFFGEISELDLNHGDLHCHSSIVFMGQKK
ncbi:MAG: class I SAM-dependent methyltransferase [Methanothrix sp.]|nr:class I SAM-dependent methyltransferase [Methanothrix sp.]MDD4446217.1 class I SAM-dependent methyltransferase [Methanothrix sp.]